MTILAIDTSTGAASCALLHNDQLVGEFFTDTTITHSQTILPLVQQLLAFTAVPLSQVDLLAVSHGPGSFTGLRIGISTIKGMALPLDLPVLGVSTLEALAYNIIGQTGFILPALNARRGNLYTAVFQSDGHQLTQQVADSNISILSLGETLHTLHQKHPTLPCFLLGDGAVLTQQTLAETHPYLQLVSPPLQQPRASSVALAAREIYRHHGTQTAAQLQPSYLRITQAERERQQGIDHSR